MSTYSIAPAGVVYESKSVAIVVAGEALDAGEVIYIDSTTGKAMKAVNNDTAPKAEVVGLVVNSADADQPVAYVASGEVEVGVVLPASGHLLVLSSTAGALADSGDLTTGQHVTLIGWSTATNKLKLNIVKTGVTAP